MSELRQVLRSHFPELDDVPEGCFVVGGALRDFLRGVEPVDLDLAAERARDRAEEFARRTDGRLVELGAERFQTFRVIVSGRLYDFTEMVGPSIETDLARRDFTINALALGSDDELLDPHGGRRDLGGGIVRMIGEENLVEDPLRMLKAIRMAVQLDCAIEPLTESAIRRHASKLERVAPERVTYELNLILDNFDRPYGLGLLEATELDRTIFRRPLSKASLEAIARIEDDDRIVAYAIVLDRREVDEHAERWRWSEDDRIAVQRLLRAVDETTLLPIRLYDAGRETSFRLPTLLRALARDEAAEEVERLLRTRGDAIFDLVPMLSGDEIQGLLSIHPGKEVGRIKRALIEAQLNGDVTGLESAKKFVLGAAR